MIKRTKRRRFFSLPWLTTLVVLTAGCDPNYSSRAGAGGNGGGATGTGGAAVGSGGATGSGGGGAETGGSPGTGGAPATGGAQATGGAVGTGGGGDATGGTPGSGGAASTGGSSGTGGAANPGSNLITNGDFSQGDASWAFTVLNGIPIMQSTSTGALCIRGGAYSHTVGWPRDVAMALSLKGGMPYTFSYRVKADFGLPVEVKIGFATAPYDVIFRPVSSFTPTTGWTTYSHPFTPAADASPAGIAFTFGNNPPSSSNYEICFDDVSVASN